MDVATATVRRAARAGQAARADPVARCPRLRRGQGWTHLLLIVALVIGLIAAPAGAVAEDPWRGLDQPGPHEVITSEVDVPRDTDGGEPFAARLYIPRPTAAAAGTAAGAASPVVAFGHGYLAPVDLYEDTLRHLASWGITVIAPRSGGELFPSHERFAADLAAALDWVARESERDPAWPGLPVDGGARGVSGHSMGGGAAMLAAAMDPRIRTAATLAAAETDPSAIAAATSIAAPVLLIAASDDAITPVSGHQLPMYEAKASGLAELRIIEGGSHCGFLDAVPVLFGVVCDEGTIDPTDQVHISRALLTAWFRAELAGDRGARSIAWPSGDVGGTTVESKGDGPAA